MNPQQPLQPTPPPDRQAPAAPPTYQQPQATVTPVSPEQPVHKSHKKLALILLIAPTALIILSIVCGLISGMTSNTPTSDDLFGEPTPLSTTLNVLSFILGGLGFVAWLPALIIGIILLVKKN